MLRQRIIELEEQIHAPCGMSNKWNYTMDTNGLLL
jgi:hypothetical protein